MEIVMGRLQWWRYIEGFFDRYSIINGELVLHYHHMNQDMQVKTGKCHSVPTVLENGKMEHFGTMGMDKRRMF